MNIFPPTNININQRQILSTLILAGCLSLGNGLKTPESSIAVPNDLSLQINNAAVKQSLKHNYKQNYKLNHKQNSKRNGLPRSVSRNVLRDLSRRENIPIRQLKIFNYQQKTWKDGCLGLGGPAELCSQSLVPGWEVVAGNESRTWTYRTNKNGSLIRLADKPTTPDNLPNSVKNSVLKAASQRLRQPISRLSIVKAEPKTWNDSCLELGGIAESCLRTSVPGWRLVVRASKQNLVYHSNQDGSQIRFNEQASDNTDVKLPKNIRSAVLRDAALWSQISPSELSIIKAKRKTWDNPCFLTFKRYCNFAFIKTPGWIVTVKGGAQTWVYHTDEKASVVVLDRTPSLSKAAARVIKRDAAKRSLVKRAQPYSPVSNFRIIEVEKLNHWNGKGFREPGWKATVSNGKQSWVYRVNENGSKLKFLPVASLPQSIIDAVLADAKVRSNQSRGISESNIVAAKPVRWRNSCLGLRGRRRYCVMRIVDGWRVTVKAGSELLVYHTNNRSRIKFNAAASQIIDDIASSQAVPIPKRELPTPLNRDTIFRQVSRAGFSGLTYQMVLLKDGRLMLSRVGDTNDSSRAVWRISRSQVRRFQRLLQRGRREFRNVNYPASHGAADYKTYILTSDRGSVQYNDISRENIPEDLQAIVQGWDSLIRSGRR